MQIEFKETVPGVLVGNYHDAGTQEFRCVVVMESLQEWSAYIDGDLLGGGFPTAQEARDFALKAIESGQRDRTRLKRTLISLALLFLGAIVYWAIHAGHFNAVSQALAAAIAPLERNVVHANSLGPFEASTVARPPSSVRSPSSVLTEQQTASRPAKSSLPHESYRIANVRGAGDAVNETTDYTVGAGPLLRPSRDQIAMPPIPLPLTRAEPVARREMAAIAPARREIEHNKSRSQPRTVELTDVSRETRAQERERTIRRLVEIKAARQAKIARERSATRKKQLVRRRAASKKFAARKRAALPKRVKQRKKFAIRKKIARMRVRQAKSRRNARRRPSGHRRMTYRQFQMLRNRIIAKRIRQRRRYATGR